jgi:hypothetical protein
VDCVCNVDATVGSHRDAISPNELPVARALSVPFVNEHAFGGELLYLVVESVYNVDATVSVHSRQKISQRIHVGSLQSSGARPAK